MLHYLLPDVDGVPVLMYHRVRPEGPDGLTVTVAQLREQWTYLRDAGYRPIRLSEFRAAVEGAPLPVEKPVLLTFDDGYRDNYEHLYPLAQSFGWPFAIFLIGCTLDGEPYDERPGYEKLTPAQLRAMTDLAEYGLHGYRHEHFSQLSAEPMIDIMERSVDAFARHDIPLTEALAFPYGALPSAACEPTLREWMQRRDMLAFRIGNRPQKLPVENRYALRRIDIRGTDSLSDFKIKLRKGKLKPF